MVNKNAPSSRKRKDLSHSLFLCGITVPLNTTALYFFKRFDLTSEKRYTLSSSTIEMLKNLDDEVYLKIYLQGDFNPSFTRLKNEAREILGEFRAYAKDNVQYEFIHPS